MIFSPRKHRARDFVDARGCGLTQADRAKRHLVMLQAFFDDSGSDPSSQHYVLAGFVASLETWGSVTEIWDYHLKKNPPLTYFKMSEAMGLNGEFKGWDWRDRNTRVNEFSEILAKSDLLRVQVYLQRNHFDDFVKGTIFQNSFDDPYFICFNHLCLSLAATEEIGWSPDYEIIFDEHGKIGRNAVFWWDYSMKYIDPKWAAKLGSAPNFKNDVKFKPLQMADMLAWLIRDGLGRPGPLKETDSAAIPAQNMAKLPAISKHVSRDELMQLGASMLVANSNLVRDFGTSDFVYEQSSKTFVRKRPRSRPPQDPEQSA